VDSTASTNRAVLESLALALLEKVLRNVFFLLRLALERGTLVQLAAAWRADDLANGTRCRVVERARLPELDELENPPLGVGGGRDEAGRVARPLVEGELQRHGQVGADLGRDRA
jgi:hypothetical protein